MVSILDKIEKENMIMMKMNELMNKEGLKKLFKNKKVIVGTLLFVSATLVYLYNKLLPEVDVNYIDNETEEDKKE